MTRFKCAGSVQANLSQSRRIVYIMYAKWHSTCALTEAQPQHTHTHSTLSNAQLPASTTPVIAAIILVSLSQLLIYCRRPQALDSRSIYQQQLILFSLYCEPSSPSPSPPLTGQILWQFSCFRHGNCFAAYQAALMPGTFSSSANCPAQP